ncbi:membrane protein [Herbaspirillum rubrisubalbicans]|uniref:Probable membrane transporter protein n=1 Tax=Herbaspirillum rubrisubalbicans TaxID=80842 RepID=A0ABX9C3S6_9BURK|nr:sulfite exporter TauE/SafE family protein [Herbaspirillum rubrisubalbicans]MCP1573358.1 putative membrane protein YfcA [Herbaspirillum rubrisubalbicans]RAM64859.1 membrane protein [Herbaspirillum rubrisubalbicans]RAN48178.1 membrane protein [Herbaspirillum rubrisubalbicans]
MPSLLAFVDMNATVLLVSLAVFLLAGFVKGVIGLGLPTVAVGLLSLVMSPVQAAALLIVPSMVTNGWQLATGGAFLALARRLWTMLAGILIGTLAGAGFMGADGGRRAIVVLGLALMLYAIAGLAAWTPTVRPGQEVWWSPVIGLFTGLVTAATGVFVIPAVPYLQALGLPRDQLIQALGLSFTVSTLALAVNLGQGGAFSGGVGWASLVVLVPALLGMAIGTRVRGLVRAATFRRSFFIGLLLLGLHLAWHIVDLFGVGR